MDDIGSLEAATTPAAVVAELERRAQRLETPCGEGRMVWHVWGDGPPLVLFHGAHGSWTHWIRNIDTLAAQRTVYAADLPGLGDSASPPRPDDIISIAEASAAGLRELLGAQAPVDVAGFSFGGVVGANLSILAPELVRRLILIDTGGLGAPHQPPRLGPVRGLEGEALRQAHRSNLAGLMLHDIEAADDLALFLQAMNVPKARIKPGPMVLPDRLVHVLHRVPAQIDIVWGEFDWPHPNPEDQLAVLRRFQPQAELRVVPNAGHWSLYENAPAANAALLDLLARPLRGA
jgi:pimeloyl-ACP methyl ester carboxylesterase